MTAKYRGRRPARVWRGYVLKVGRTSLWVRLEPVRFRGPDVDAEFPLRLLPDAIDGQYVSLHVYRRRSLLIDRTPPPWSPEELAEIWERARKRAALFQTIAD